MRCWAMTQGAAGMENQTVGLAEALGVVPEVKRIALRQPWKALTPWLPLDPRVALAAGSDRLDPPWPDLLITCGRQSVGLALAVKRRSGGRTFCVHIQDPKVPFGWFDLVAIPQHDGRDGGNVVVTRGAIHRVTRARLDSEAARVAPLVAHLPRPLVAVLIGGSNAVYRLTPEIMGDVAEKLARLGKSRNVGLMVTPSRRTGADNRAILDARLRDVPAVLWDGTGDNPYFGFLGLADAIVVTADSVSMASEAAFTGKPLYIVELEGGSPKFRRFLDGLYANGIARPFAGELDRWSYPPLDDTGRVAEAIRAKLGAVP